MIAENLSSNKKPIQKTGSPQSGGPAYLTIGKLQRTHGVKGEIVMQIMTDFPEKIVKGKVVFIGARHVEYVVRSVRATDQKLLVSFEGLNDCDQVAILRNQVVTIKTEDANQLPEGEFYHHELIGMKVCEENGTLVGTVQEILVTGANDVYVVQQADGGEVLIPAIRDVILNIDSKNGRMTVKLPEWD